MYKDAYCRTSDKELIDVYVNTTRFIDRLIQHLPTLKRVKSGKNVLLSFDKGLLSAFHASRTDTLDKETLYVTKYV